MPVDAECVATSGACLAVTFLAGVGHFLLSLFYWYKTGTTPMKEEIFKKIEELQESREERHKMHAVSRSLEKFLNGILVKDDDAFESPVFLASVSE